MRPQDFTNPLYEGFSSRLMEDGEDWPGARRSSNRRGDSFSSKKMADRQTYRAVRMHITRRARIKALQSQEFCDNMLVTSKYKITTFIPVNLFEQFSRAVNLYFLLVSVIQLIPGLSPTGIETTLVPLLFVLLVKALKDAHYDYKRHKSDAEVNARKSEVLQGGGLKPLEWKSIIVGDIIRVQNNCEIPADLLFLSSSDPQGMAYLETTNLDGETNLKIRNSFYQSSTMNSEDGDVSFHGLSGLVIECEQPNNRVNEFEGFVSFQGQGLVPLDISQILLRGATLRNTEWVIGAVVFTGADTKYMRTIVPAPTKVSRLERKMNVLVSGLFVYQLILCLGLAIGHFMWTERNLHHFYLAADYVWPEPGLDLPGLLIQLLRFLILLSSLIPISLYITLELVKVIQCWFIHWDSRMFHKPAGGPAQARTLNLNEELGQVHDVLSDKTGTLTQNVMTFVQCSINGVIYGDFTRDGIWEESKSEPCMHTICEDQYLIEELQKVDALPNSQSQKCKDFFLHLAICHTAIPTYADEEETGEIIYQSSSPDEEALVKGAAICGFQLTGRDSDMLTTECQGRFPEAHTILAVLEFTSERKRMSIICKHSNGRIKLYCKGADTMILKRLAKDQGGIAETSLKHMQQFAHAGYRTLCIAEREIDEDEFEKWAYQFRAASVALDDREEKLAEATDFIERDMVLLGVTAVEDKLQNGVKESVTLLAQAGIKLWVLTGDKLETSVAVGLACNLLTDSMHIFLLCESSSNSVPQMLHNMLEEARKLTHTRISEEPAEMAVIIEGDALAVALEENNRMIFLQLCQKCRTVLCCRVSPLQKALVTQMIKENNLTVTLAIGDGANDVAMIRAAHIGVGISGREGNAAVLASDYSIGQFRFLTRLLLIHGRWSYKRNKLLVMYFIYKNIVYVMGQCYFSFYSGLSAQSIYPNVLLATYNLLWTFLPTMALSILDQDVNQHTVLTNPHLYKETQQDDIQNFFQDAGCWLITAFWHSIVVFFFPLASTQTMGQNGATNGIFNMGVSSYTLAVVVVNLKIMLCTNNLTVMSTLCVWVMSIFSYFAFLSLLSYMGLSISIFNELSDVGMKMYTSESFWMVLVLGVISAFLPGWAISKLQRQRSPEDFQIFQEVENGWRDGKSSKNSISNSRPGYLESMVGSPEFEQREMHEQFPTIKGKLSDAIEEGCVPLRRRIMLRQEFSDVNANVVPNANTCANNGMQVAMSDNTQKRVVPPLQLSTS